MESILKSSNTIQTLHVAIYADQSTYISMYPSLLSWNRIHKKSMFKQKSLHLLYINEQADFTFTKFCLTRFKEE